MRENGETSFPKPTRLQQARSSDIPSRQPGRKIPCRILMPEHSIMETEGIMMHIHGGGWVLHSEKEYAALADCALLVFGERNGNT